LNRDMFFGRYGLSTWFYVDRSLEEALVRIAEAGFRQVELWADQAHLDPRKSPDIGAIKGLLRDLDLRVYSVHLPFSGMELGSPDGALKDTWLRLAGAALEYCAQLGGQIAVVHVSGGRCLLDEERRKESVRLSIAFVQELSLIAGRLGVRLALENLLQEWSQFGRTVGELAQSFPDQEVGFCIDTGHALVNSADVAAELHGAGKRLLEVHANNNDGVRDLHQLPWRGVLDWRRVEEYLVELEYEGCRMLEVCGTGHPDVKLDQMRYLCEYI